MSDFGEPWGWWDDLGDGSLILMDRIGHSIVIKKDPKSGHHRDFVRIIACVNALTGIADPAAQVARWKAIEVLAKFHGLELRPEKIAALAADWKEDE